MNFILMNLLDICPKNIFISSNCLGKKVNKCLRQRQRPLKAWKHTSSKIITWPNVIILFWIYLNSCGQELIFDIFKLLNKTFCVIIFKTIHRFVKFWIAYLILKLKIVNLISVTVLINDELFLFSIFLNNWWF